MSKSPFGWSYPPGAENDPQAPYNQDSDGTTALQDKIIDLLVAAKIPDKHIDSILDAVMAAEEEMQNADDAAMVDELAEAHRLEREESEWLEDKNSEGETI